MGGKKFFSQVERVLHNRVARNNLQVLEDAGCNRNELISLLELAFFWTDESWKKLVDMDLRAFKDLISQVQDCARKIERLNRSELVYHLGIELRYPQFAQLHESPGLPDQLREYASTLESSRELAGPKQRVRLHVWKAWIVATVTKDTKRVYDPEVSAIISAVLRQPKYTEKAHQAWRLKNAKLVEQMRVQLLGRRGKNVSQPFPSQL